jgi:plastocyanin
MHYASRLSTALCFALIAGACSGSESTAPTNTDTFGGSATATSVDVTMPGLVYTPNRIDIAQGGTVRFIFAALAHDVRFNGATGVPADIQVTANATVSRTFATKGAFPFLCTLHANMTGTVTVH